MLTPTFPAASGCVVRAHKVPLPRLPEVTLQAPVVALTGAVRVALVFGAVHGNEFAVQRTTVTLSVSPVPWLAEPETVTECPEPAVNAVMVTVGAVLSIVTD